MLVEVTVAFTLLSGTVLVVKSIKAVSDIHVRFDRIEQRMEKTFHTVDVIEKELLRRNYL